MAAQIRLARVRAFTASNVAAALVAPAALGSALTLNGALHANLTAPVTLGAAATVTPGVHPTIRLAQVRAFTGQVGSAFLTAPVKLTGALGASSGTFSSGLTAPVRLTGVVPTGVIRLANVRAWSIQSVLVWDGSEWVPDPGAFMVAPVTMAAQTTRIVGVGGVALTAPVVMSGIGSVSRVVAAPLTAPVVLQGSIYNASGPATVMTAPVVLSATGAYTVVFGAALQAPATLTATDGQFAITTARTVYMTAGPTGVRYVAGPSAKDDN